MKPETMVGILCMVVAMVLYTVGTWGAFRAKKMRKNDVLYLIGGVVFDLIGTGAMYVAAGYQFLWAEPKTWIGMLALFAMVVVAALGQYAVGWNKDKLAVTLSKVVLGPWGLWALVFIWGFLRKPAT